MFSDLDQYLLFSLLMGQTAAVYKIGGELESGVGNQWCRNTSRVEGYWQAAGRMFLFIHWNWKE